MQNHEPVDFEKERAFREKEMISDGLKLVDLLKAAGVEIYGASFSTSEDAGNLYTIESNLRQTIFLADVHEISYDVSSKIYWDPSKINAEEVRDFLKWVKFSR